MDAIYVPEEFKGWYQSIALTEKHITCQNDIWNKCVWRIAIRLT